ncbi:uncharacterized protein E0L32_000775 [Thyridium curvatum]|uniref:Uncharacterized protein n=1 Tax=Thyridium curvatum TaxID=1093900 RepID=A0A507B757_9PEZI|nr:uncharacterized protein E0L32_000775 [Thyridium curvatum]TPX12598.1 hypothetical protein E0L32_000775 [Thyridium curvatum]
MSSDNRQKYGPHGRSAQSATPYPREGYQVPQIARPSGSWYSPAAPTYTQNNPSYGYPHPNVQPYPTYQSNPSYGYPGPNQRSNLSASAAEFVPNQPHHGAGGGQDFSQRQKHSLAVHKVRQHQESDDKSDQMRDFDRRLKEMERSHKQDKDDNKVSFAVVWEKLEQHDKAVSFLEPALVEKIFSLIPATKKEESKTNTLPKPPSRKRARTEE